MYTQHSVSCIRYRKAMLFFFCGAVILCVFSMCQKIVIGVPLFVIKGYIVPFLFGGTTGLLLGLWHDKLRRFRRELESQVERKTKDLTNTLVRLQDSEEKYRSIFEKSPIAIERYDAQGTLNDINEACKALFGVENPRELMEFNLFEDPNLPEEEKVKLLAGSAVSYQVPFDFTKVKEKNLYSTSRNGISWLDVVIVPMGEPFYGYLVQIQDITERKNAQTALQESETRWSFALEGAGDGVWDWNAATGRVFFSRKWKEMLGYDEEEIGDTLDEWSSRVHPEDKPSVDRDLEAHLQGNTFVYQNEHRVLCKDGSYKWIMDRGKVVEWTEEGIPQRIIGTHSDISERKKVEVEREKLVSELQEALGKVKTLSGLLPICMHCKKIRDDKGYWNQIESYIHEHSDAEFSHSICKECAEKYYPDMDLYED